MIQLGLNMQDKIQRITYDAKKRGYDVRIRDISYACLKSVLGDENIAYTVVFGTPQTDHDVSDYDSMDSIQYLAEWFEDDFTPKEVKKERPEDVIKALKKKNDTDDSGSMTFEENRAGIEKQIEEILELKKELIDDNGKCTDVKTMATLQKTEADLRSKLNDKFGASEKSKEQYVIVQPKFNTICEHTRKECWLQTKEYAMQHWHLIPDPKWKGGSYE